MTWKWLVAGIVVLLLLAMTLREGFEATETIKDPSTWDAAEFERIRKMVTPESTLPDDQIRDIVGGFWRYEVRSRGSETPTPKGWSAATSAITTRDINEYVNTVMSSAVGDKEQARQLLKAYYIDQGQTVFQQARNYVASYTPPDEPIQNPTEPTATTETSPEAETPTSPGAPTTDSQSEPPVPGSSGSGATSGTSTGGSSGTSFGPNSAPKGGRNVWGPIFKGIGEGGPRPGGDSTTTNTYPSLLGGMGGRTSTRVEGVGVVPPSGLGLDTVMPSSSSLGTDANARFLPYSRQPGDMDLIPDPYRLAKNFSSSSYSASKTDPVPFLTDFSAFYR